MKILSKLIILFLLLALLCGCNKQTSPKLDGYQIVQDGDIRYVTWDDDTETEAGAGDSYSCTRAIPQLQFATIEEMIHDIENGDFTEDQIQLLKAQKRQDDYLKNNQKIIIPDFSKLYAPVYPDDVTFKNVKWQWRGLYTYEFDCGENIGEVHMYAISEILWQYHIKHWMNPESFMLGKTIETVTDEETGTTVYNTKLSWYSDDEYEIHHQYTLYTIVKDNRTYYVVEHLQTFEADRLLSLFGSKVSYGFDVYVTDQQNYWHLASKDTIDHEVYLSGEWITSFDWEAYIPVK